MIAALENSADRLRQRVSLALYSAALARHTLWVLLAGGTLALLARQVAGLSRAQAAWAFAPLVLVPLSAWLVTRARSLSLEGAVTWLDVRTRAGGALLTGFELRDPRWQAQVDQALRREVALPRARLARPALELLAAASFAALGLWLEFPRDPALPPRALQQAAIERVEEKLETLKEEATLDSELATELETRLERAQDASATPEQAFEAIDRVDERLAQAGDELAEELRDAQQSLSSAESSAGADPEGAQRSLEETLKKLSQAGLGKNLPEELTRELGGASLELPPGTKLDASKLGALSRELNQALAAKLAKLGAAGLAKLGKLARAGELAGLGDFKPTGHVCDENCAKKPGGT